jgi:CHAT domain-containing protein
MSLWKVPDRQTRELMIDLHTRLVAAQPRADALRQAQLELRKRHPEPLYWGAFICQGDPGPIARLHDAMFT